MRIRLNEFTLAYDQVGTGIPIVFIHGYPMNRTLWEPQMELADTALLLPIDLRGHGESEKTPGPYSMDLMADDCKEFLDRKKIKKAVLCGLSMGGYISLAFLRKYPDRLAGLILTATRAAADSQQARENRDKSINQAMTQGVEPIIENMIPRLLSPFSIQNRSEMAENARQVMLGISVQTVIADLQGLKERADSNDLLSKIHLPVCILHGEDDQIIPVSEAYEMHQSISGSQFYMIPRAGHVLNLEQPEIFNNYIRRFIADLTLSKDNHG